MSLGAVKSEGPLNLQCVGSLGKRLRNYHPANECLLEYQVELGRVNWDGRAPIELLISSLSLTYGTVRTEAALFTFRKVITASRS